MSEDTAQRLRTERLSADAEQLGLKDPTTPELVRWIYPEEIGATTVECLAAKGYEATVARGGTGISARVPKNQEEPFAIAQYECKAMYTIDPRVEVQVTPERLRIVHEYMTEFVWTCLQENGYASVAPPPSLEVFIEQDGYWPDYPWADERANSTCPINPPTRALLGESY